MRRIGEIRQQLSGNLFNPVCSSQSQGMVAGSSARQPGLLSAPLALPRDTFFITSRCIYFNGHEGGRPCHTHQHYRLWGGSNPPASFPDVPKLAPRPFPSDPMPPPSDVPIYQTPTRSTVSPLLACSPQCTKDRLTNKPTCGSKYAYADK